MPDTPEMPLPGVDLPRTTLTTAQLHPLALQIMGPLQMPDLRMLRQSVLPEHEQRSTRLVPQIKLFDMAMAVPADDSSIVAMTKAPMVIDFMGNSRFGSRIRSGIENAK
jgi:hypothetical protein